MISFHLPIVPPKATSQTKRLVMVGGKPRFFPTKDHQQAEGDLLALCAEHAPPAPLEGPVSLSVSFTFPWRKSETKKRRARTLLPNDKRPDLDNLVKLIGDVLTKLRFYNDDGQVSTLLVSKWWGDNVGISVSIENQEHQ